SMVPITSFRKMRIAHLIMAHKNCLQLGKLIHRMMDPRFDIYVHLDKKSDISEFEHLKNIDRVFFIQNRIKTNWGRYSIVNGITESLREIINQEVKYDYINLLSGQDYPIKSSDQFYDYIKEHFGTSFISYDSSGSSEWWEHAVTRYEHYHFTDINIRGRYRVQWLLNRYMPKRKFPLSIKLYGGKRSTWWTITYDCAQYLVNFLDSNKKLVNFMKFTWGADEFLYPTIIMNSPFSCRTVNNNLRHIEWHEGQCSPEILNERSFESLRFSKSFFARKFDPEEDSQIISMLDKLISP